MGFTIIAIKITMFLSLLCAQKIDSNDKQWKVQTCSRADANGAGMCASKLEMHRQIAVKCQTINVIAMQLIYCCEMSVHRHCCCAQQNTVKLHLMWKISVSLGNWLALLNNCLYILIRKFRPNQIKSNSIKTARKCAK